MSESINFFDEPGLYGWYWADETWNWQGPCESYEQAKAEQKAYVEKYL